MHAPIISYLSIFVLLRQPFPPSQWAVRFEDVMSHPHPVHGLSDEYTCRVKTIVAHWQSSLPTTDSVVTKTALYSHKASINWSTFLSDRAGISTFNFHSCCKKLASRLGIKITLNYRAYIEQLYNNICEFKWEHTETIHSYKHIVLCILFLLL